MNLGYRTRTQTAEQTPFDGAENGFTSDNVQGAIIEVGIRSQPSTVSCQFFSIHQIMTNEEFACDGISRISLNRISIYNSPRVILIDETANVMANFIDRVVI